MMTQSEHFDRSSEPASRGLSLISSVFACVRDFNPEERRKQRIRRALVKQCFEEPVAERV